VVGRGPRPTQAWLLAEVSRELERVREDVSLLARPVRIVVPSRSLRLHLAERLLARRGRAAIGIEVQTLRGLANGVARDAGVGLDEDALFPILVRREARRETCLAAGLDPLADGYGAVVAVVDDLLDAGFESVHADALLERITATDVGPDRAERARALVRVTARVADAVASGAIGHRSQPYVVARERIARAPESLPTRALFLYGFADATGVQADLIETLLRLPGARIALDAPPTTDARPAGGSFGAAFRDRLLAGSDAVPLPDTGAAARVTLLRAASRAAEVRAVATRLRARLDAGAEPEHLVVVARDLAPYRLALRRELGRLGVPFSGLGEPGAATPARRRLHALLAVLEDAADVRMEVWLDAHERVHKADGSRSPVSATHRADLRQALHRRGAVRLSDVAHFAAEPPGVVALSARHGLRQTPEREGGRAPRREVSEAALAAAARSADAVGRRLAQRPSRVPLAEHRAWLTRLVRDLGWLRGRWSRCRTPISPSRRKSSGGCCTAHSTAPGWRRSAARAAESSCSA
jgi:hypothetical protein